MTEWIPCPACGTEHGPEAAACEVCGYRLQAAGIPATNKCARCGSGLGEGFEFCQICGLRVQSRLPRPTTQSLKLVPRRGPETVAPPLEPPLESPAAAAGIASPVEADRPGNSEAEPTLESPAVSPIAPAASEAPTAGEAPGERGALGPGDTAKMSRGSLGLGVLEAPEPAIRPAEPAGSVPAWTAPMARLAVESARRSAGAALLRVVLVQRDGSEGDSVPLRGPLVVGRLQGDLQFPGDEFISPVHACLEPAPGGGVRLSDLQSRNGVYVRISRPEPVFPGDFFLVGHHLIRLENVPSGGKEQELGDDGVRLFGTPMQPSWGRLTLIGVGGAEAEVHCLRAPQIVFGRELGDIIFPTDPFVSWQHAQLSLEMRDDAMSVTLTDLRSANGTYLRIRGDVILQPGDMFRVGDQIFRVRMH